jgi:hypothetical protein
MMSSSIESHSTQCHCFTSNNMCHITSTIPAASLMVEVEMLIIQYMIATISGPWILCSFPPIVSLPTISQPYLPFPSNFCGSVSYLANPYCVVCSFLLKCTHFFPQNYHDPLIVQPALLDVATIKKEEA